MGLGFCAGVLQVGSTQLSAGHLHSSVSLWLLWASPCAGELQSFCDVRLTFLFVRHASIDLGA